MSELSLDEQLWEAARNGYVTLCLVLIDRGADLAAQDEDGRRALHEAAFRGHTVTCLALLDRGADLQAQDKHGRTALQEAAWNGSTETCLALIDRGAHLEAHDKQGKTALYWSALKGYNETCLSLIAHGADPSKAPKDMRSLTPIEAAARGGFIPRLMTLFEASEVDHQALADLALEHGQEEAAAAIRSHAARAQLKNIAKGAAPCLG